MGSDLTASDGSLLRNRGMLFDGIGGSIALRSPDDAEMWRGLLEGRGHRWSFDKDSGYNGSNPSAGGDPYSTDGLFADGIFSRRIGVPEEGYTGTSGAGSTVAFGSDARFGAAGAVEEGRTNLFPETVRRGGDGSSGNNVHRFYAVDATVAISDPNGGLEGSYGVVVTASSGGYLSGAETRTSGESWQIGTAAVAAATTYTFSFYARSSSGSVPFQATAFDSGGASRTTPVLTATTTWRRFALCLTTSSGSGLTAGLRWMMGNAGQSITIDMIQCEAGNFASSWVGAANSGTASRAASSGLQLTLQGFRRQDSLTLSGWFKGPHRSLATGSAYAASATLLSIGDLSNGLVLRRNTSVQLVLEQYSSGAASTLATVSSSGEDADWRHYVVIARRAPQAGAPTFELWASGSLVGTSSTAVAGLGTAPKAWIGSRFGESSQRFNGLVDEVVFLPFAVSPAGVAALGGGVWSSLPLVDVAGDVIGNEAIECLPSVTADGIRLTSGAWPGVGFSDRLGTLSFQLQQARR